MLVVHPEFFGMYPPPRSSLKDTCGHHSVLMLSLITWDTGGGGDYRCCCALLARHRGVAHTRLGRSGSQHAVQRKVEDGGHASLDYARASSRSSVRGRRGVCHASAARRSGGAYASMRRLSGTAGFGGPGAAPPPPPPARRLSHPPLPPHRLRWPPAGKDGTG